MRAIAKSHPLPEPQEVAVPRFRHGDCNSRRGQSESTRIHPDLSSIFGEDSRLSHLADGDPLSAMVYDKDLAFLAGDFQHSLKKADDPFI